MSIRSHTCNTNQTGHMIIIQNLDDILQKACTQTQIFNICWVETSQTRLELSSEERHFNRTAQIAAERTRGYVHAAKGSNQNKQIFHWSLARRMKSCC